MNCLAAIAFLAAVATATPIGNRFYYSEIPTSRFLQQHGDHFDLLRSSVYEKPIFIATRGAGDGDHLTATLIDGGYQSLAVKPQYRHFRDNLLTGDKMVFLLNPTVRTAPSVLPLRHLIVPEHYGTMKSTEFEESMLSHPWMVLLDQADMHSDLYSNLMRNHAIDVTDDSMRLLKSALIGYEPLHRSAGVRYVSPQRSLSDLTFEPAHQSYAMPYFLPLRSLSHSRHTPLHRSMPLPYVIPQRSFSDFEYQPVQRVAAHPYALPQEPILIHPQYQKILLNDEQTVKPTYFLLYNAKDLSDAKEISEEEVMRLLKLGKMSDLSNLGSRSLIQSGTEGKSTNAMLHATQQSELASALSALSAGASKSSTSESMIKSEHSSGLLGSAVNTGVNVVSTGAKAIEAASSAVKDSSILAGEKNVGILGTIGQTGAGLISTGARVVQAGADEVSKTIEESSFKSSSMNSESSSSSGLLSGSLQKTGSILEHNPVGITLN